MLRRLLVTLHLIALYASGAPKLSALIVDGMNNHDWAAGTRAIQAILEGSGRFRVEICTWPAPCDFRGYDVVIDNFNGGHLANGTRWPRETERALETYVREGGGLVVFHAANNAFLDWPAFNDMIGLGWRDRSFGPGIAIGPGGALVTVPKGKRAQPRTRPATRFRDFRAGAGAPNPPADCPRTGYIPPSSSLTDSTAPRKASPC